MAKRAHLVKVLVQTVWVVVDDETGTAEEFADTGVSVPAAEWPGFYKRHVADFQTIQATTAAEGAVTANGSRTRSTRKDPHGAAHNHRP